jgi:peptidoglycan/xylan/chitin deacetylase (PgdA/CDA1 family)
MGRADRMLVLTWHAIDERSSVISMPPGLFRLQVETLAGLGIRGISLAQAFDHLERTGTFPDRSVVLTFDDGFRSVHCVALPVLAAHGFSATVFLVSGLVGLPATEVQARQPDLDGDLLDWEQAAALPRAGFEIGSHCVTHPDLTRLDPAGLERELHDARSQLERRLSVPIESLAYPYGRLNPAVRDAAARHYRRACTTRLAPYERGADVLRIDRIDMYYMRPVSRFQQLLDGRLDHWLRARRLLRAVKRLAR